MPYSRIRDLNALKDTWAIQARLCRMWEAVDFKNDNEVFALEMIFVDDQGDSIQSYFRKNHIMRFKPMFKESEVYVVRNFKVARASAQYKVVPNTQRIYFNVTTSVHAVTPIPDTIPHHVFFFASEDVLEGRVGNNTVLTGYFSYGSTAAAKIYFNLELPEVTSFRQTFTEGYEGIKTLQHEPAGQASLAEQASLNRTTIREVLAMEWVSAKQEHFCTIVGEIVEVDVRYGWCYVSCNHCNKKLIPQSGTFHCKMCNKTCSYPVIRYKVHVRAKDSTGSTTLTIFNDDVEKLVRIPANSFMERIGTGEKALPPEISNLVGKIFVFKLKVRDYNLKDGFENYTMTKIFEEVSADHKRKVQPGNSATHVLPSTGIESPMSSASTHMSPVTPQKNTIESKKIKLEV